MEGGGGEVFLFVLLFIGIWLWRGISTWISIIGVRSSTNLGGRIDYHISLCFFVLHVLCFRKGSKEGGRKEGNIIRFGG
jgi:hypothetical protein